MCKLPLHDTVTSAEQVVNSVSLMLTCEQPTTQSCELLRGYKWCCKFSHVNQKRKPKQGTKIKLDLVNLPLSYWGWWGIPVWLPVVKGRNACQIVVRKLFIILWIYNFPINKWTKHTVLTANTKAWKINKCSVACLNPTTWWINIWQINSVHFFFLVPQLKQVFTR